MFDDGGLSNKKGLVKVELLNVISGDVLIGYERYLFKHLSVFVGAGPRLSYWNAGITSLFSGDPDEMLEIPDASGGYVFALEVRRYPSSRTNGLYSSLSYQLQSVSRASGDAYRTSIYSIGLGYVYPITSRLQVDGAFGVGVKILNEAASKSLNPNSNGNYFNFTPTLNLKLGYFF